MTVLQNSTETARQCATALSSAVSTLGSSGAVTKDTRTTIAGNTQSAYQAIDLSQSISTQIAGIISSMSQNIQSVSSQFQAMDTSMGQQLSNLDASRGFTINGSK